MAAGVRLAGMMKTASKGARCGDVKRRSGKIPSKGQRTAPDECRGKAQKNRSTIKAERFLLTLRPRLFCVDKKDAHLKVLQYNNLRDCHFSVSNLFAKTHRSIQPPPYQRLVLS